MKRWAQIMLHGVLAGMTWFGVSIAADHVRLNGTAHILTCHPRALVVAQLHREGLRLGAVQLELEDGSNVSLWIDHRNIAAVMLLTLPARDMACPLWTPHDLLPRPRGKA